MFGLIFLAFLLLIGLSIWALARQSALQSQLDALKRRIATLEATAAPREPVAAPPHTAPATLAAEAAPPPAPAPAPTIAPTIAQPPSPTRATVPPMPQPRPASAPAAARGLAGIEDQLMRRWLIWLGALALALGAVFLVKYSIDQGWFGPRVRIASGIALGFVLLALGEYTRQRSATQAQASYIPAGLTASGIVALFASIYAAYALYHLLAAVLTFILLAAIAAAAAVLAVFHGPLLAVLGLGGAYGVPLLVGSEHPSTSGLLIYVLLVTAASLTLLRWRGWPWLGWIITAGAIFWAVLAFLMPDHRLALGLYLCVIPPLIVALYPVEREKAARPGFIWTTIILDTVLMAWLVLEAAHEPTTLALSALLSALLVAIAWRDHGFDRLAWLAALLQLAVLESWHLPRPDFADPATFYVWAAPQPPAAAAYLGFAATAAAAFGLVGYAALPRQRNPARWGFLSAAAPLLILVVAYWRMTLFGVSLPWAIAALALAALDLLACETLLPRRDDADARAALAAYAVALIGSIALGMTMSLRTGWLSVALALELPALVWLDRHLQVKAIRQTAMVMAAIVLIRLIFNPNILDYDFGQAPLFNGLLYTYGIPFIAFFVASRGFKPARDEMLSAILEGGTIALGAVLVALEIRHYLHHGALREPSYGLLEQALLTDAWLTIAYGLLPRVPKPEQRLRIAAAQCLAAIALVNLFLFPLLFSNPLLGPVPVGDLFIVNDLLFAYAIPAILGVLFYRKLLGAIPSGWSATLGIASSIMGFIYLSYEVRHWFHGSYLLRGRSGDAEWYAYSAAWLLYGVALMVCGIVFRLPKLRVLALGIGAIVAAKVFLFDMAALSGLYRAASFLGFGASLIALGYLYQRLVALTAPEARDFPSAG